MAKFRLGDLADGAEPVCEYHSWVCVVVVSVGMGGSYTEMQ